MAKKKKEETPVPGSPAWMATFSDLMNLLLCFFVLLYASSTPDAAKFEQIAASFMQTVSILQGGEAAIGEDMMISNGVSQLNALDDYVQMMGKADEGDESNPNEGQPSKEEQEMLELSKNMASEIVKELESNKLDDLVNVDYNAQFVQLSLNGAIVFDSGKAEIKKSAIPTVSRVGDILKKYDKCVVEIEGHTDKVPIHSLKYENNLYLSAARAITVYEYLIENKKMNPEYLKASGYGDNLPVASNKTESGRAKNRRVEIKIYNRLSSKNR